MVTEQLDGVSSSFVDLEAKKGTFEVEGEGMVEKITTAISELGYTATVA